MKEWIFRTERPSDFAAVEFLTREAFWDVYQPGCDEHCIVHRMRGDPDVAVALNLVCEGEDGIVGHIFYTHTKVVDDRGAEHPVLSFGPISVRPDCQRKGVGAQLIRRTLAMAAQMGFGGVVITGGPAYYGRFGFRPAADYGIVMDDGSSFPELMAMELRSGGMEGIHGRMHFAPKFFNIDQGALAAFDARFPAREKRFGQPGGRRILRPAGGEYSQRALDLVEEVFAECADAREGRAVRALVEEIRAKRFYVPQLELVMTDEGGEAIGYAMFSRFHLEGKYGDRLLMLGPVAVKTSLQRQHISRDLLEYGFCAAREMGFQAVIVEGDPANYRARGFVTSSDHGIVPGSSVRIASPELLMVKELVGGALQSIRGTVEYCDYRALTEE